MESVDMIGTDWPYVVDLMPADLEQSAVDQLAFRRRRGIASATDLLRLALCYGFCDLSLRQTAMQAALLGWGELSDVAVLNRLRHAADWLGYVVLRYLADRGLTRDVPAWPVRVLDATTIAAPGSRGTDWRLHLGLDLAHLALTSAELTGAEGGETFTRHAVAAGEILLADRGYAHRQGVASVLDRQAHVVVRLNWQNFPLTTRSGRALDLVAIAEGLAPDEIGDYDAQFRHKERDYPVRLLILRKSPAAALKAQRQLGHEATRKGRQLDPRSLRAAHFVYVLTDLPRTQLPAAQGLELYRLRWQIEIAFKRLKSLVHLDRLRAKDRALARAYLYAKLLGALIVDDLSRGALAFFPWGYRLFPTAHQSLALAADDG
jgi:hypothetical protein